LGVDDRSLKAGRSTDVVILIFCHEFCHRRGNTQLGFFPHTEQSKYRHGLKDAALPIFEGRSRLQILNTKLTPPQLHGLHIIAVMLCFLYNPISQIPGVSRLPLTISILQKLRIY
jgi:hypothetical protein